MFRRQVYGSDVDPETVEDAMRIVYSQSKKVRVVSKIRSTAHLTSSPQLLQEYGLDFRFLFEELLVEKPKIKDTVTSSAPFTFRRNQISKPAEPLRTPVLPSSIRRSLAPRPASPPSILPASTYAASASVTSNSDTPLAPSIPSDFHSSLARSRSSPLTTSTYAAASAQLPTSLSTRSRTPTSTAPASAPLSVPPLPVPLVSPAPRRAKSPTASALPQRQASAPTYRERPPRPLKASPAPPPRSMNRPGSATSRRPPPVAVPQREGMI